MVPEPDPADRSENRQRSREHTGDEETPPQRELRWVQLREPKHAIEIGRNGRVLASRFHEGYDSWEVLLETYEGEV